VARGEKGRGEEELAAVITSKEKRARRSQGERRAEKEGAEVGERSELRSRPLMGE